MTKVTSVLRLLYKKVAENWIYAVSATRYEVIIFLFF